MTGTSPIPGSSNDEEGRNVASTDGRSTPLPDFKYCDRCGDRQPHADRTTPLCRACENIDGTTLYGFRWGPADVTRCCELPGDRRVIQVKTPHRSLDIYVSATGRSVRVFSGGKEWTA